MLSETKILDFVNLVCQWWNAVPIQAQRCLNLLGSSSGKLPWEEENLMCSFLPERIFLILAINHAIKGIEILDKHLKSEGNTSLSLILREIEKVASIEDIRDLRNMNEHSLDYIADEGRDKQKFQRTSPLWTVCTTKIIFGNVDISALIDCMNRLLPSVRNALEEIFIQKYKSSIQCSRL